MKNLIFGLVATFSLMSFAPNSHSTSSEDSDLYRVCCTSSYRSLSVTYCEPGVDRDHACSISRDLLVIAAMDQDESEHED